MNKQSYKRSFKLLLLLAICLSTFKIQAQILEPVKWSYKSEIVSKTEARIIITANIDPGWHVYAQNIEEGGPIPTSFKFKPNAAYKLSGKVTEYPVAKSVMDKTFGMNIASHEKKVVFTQKIILSKPVTKIEGVLEFMVCNDTQCLPPEEKEFSIAVNASNVSASAVALKDSSLQKPITTSPDTVKTSQSIAGDSSSVSEIKKEKSLIKDVSTNDQDKSLLAIFLAGFLGGFAALIMPCIFPMLPLTVSYFTKRGGSKTAAITQASIYGISIIFIYVVLGLLVTVIFGSDALNELASNGVFNFVFFLLLIIFAISFFGAFDINLPSSWVNKVDEKSDKTGFSGLFFMALALALVSFSCTGPIIGTLLVEAASTRTLLGPAAGMLGFSLALALPFTIFAAFPSLLKSLPKSGGWLNTVKVVLGFLELALALKFLSNVDLAYHWNLFDREVFLVLWIVIFGLMGIYILGKLKFAHDSDVPYVTIPRLFMAILVFSFTVYMIPGLWGAPLKSISAFLPPLTTQDFDLYTNSISSASGDSSAKAKKYTSLFKTPFNINAFYDMDEGIAYAKKVNKPVLIDFTGHSCVNCRKMENAVWSDKEVLKRLKEDYVLISLYVDDKTDLPKSEQYVSKFSGKKIKTIGNKWSDYQASVYGVNSQPYYVVINHESEILVPPQAFNLDIRNYINFLDEGKNAFTSRK